MKKNIMLFLFTSISITSISCDNPNSTFSNKNNAKKIAFNKLYVLGDSLSDTGSYTGILSGYSKKSKGISFDDPPFHIGKSFTNGEVAVEVLVKKMGLQITPGWDAPSLNIFGFSIRGSSQVGTNYAVSGAKASIGKSEMDIKFINHISLEKK